MFCLWKWKEKQNKTLCQTFFSTGVLPPRGASKAFEHMLHVVKGSKEGLALTFTGKQSPFLEFLSFKKENAIVIKMRENYEAVCTFFNLLIVINISIKISITISIKFLKLHKCFSKLDTSFKFRFHSNTLLNIQKRFVESERPLTILWIVHIVMAFINDLFSSKYKKFVWGRYVFRQICSSLWIGKGKGKLGDSSSFSASPKFYKFFLEKLTTTRLGNIQEPFVIWPLQTFQHHVRTIKTRSQITHSNILSEISLNKTTSPISRYNYRIQAYLQCIGPPPNFSD